MADYILEPLDTDTDVIYQKFVEFIQGYFPDWQPSEGQLDVIIARYFAMQTAFTADMASRVLRAIYRYFGSSLAGIPPLPGSPAQARVHFTVSDPADPPVDRVLPFGTLVGLTDRDGDIQMFALLDDMIVLAGTTSGEVDTQAIELGSIANDISGPVELVELVDWIESASVVGASGGGSNPEDDEVYIQRLTENLALMAPRPILADDFAVFAKNIPGVWRATVIDNFRPGDLEVQRLTSDRTAGTFTLSFYGEVTDALPFDATAEQVYAELLALGNFDITDARVTGGPLPTAPITFTFGGKYAYMNVDTLVLDGSGLSGGTGASISTITPGTAYGTDMENSIAISAVDENGNPIPDPVRDDLIAYLQSTRPQNFVITFVDPAYYEVHIEATARALQRQDPAAVKSLAESQFVQFLRPERWGLYPYQSNNRTWILMPTVRYLELTTVLENTPGVDYTEELNFQVDNSALDTADKDLASPFALTRPGSIDVTVNLPS